MIEDEEDSSEAGLFFEDTADSVSNGSEHTTHRGVQKGSTKKKNMLHDDDESTSSYDDTESPPDGKKLGHQADGENRGMIRRMLSGQGLSSKLSPETTDGKSFRKLSFRNLFSQSSTSSFGGDPQNKEDVQDVSKTLDKPNPSDNTKQSEDNSTSNASDDNSAINIKWLSDDEGYGSSGGNWHDSDASVTSKESQQSSNDSVRPTIHRSRSRSSRRQSTRRSESKSRTKRHRRREVSESPCRDREERHQSKSGRRGHRNKERKGSSGTDRVRRNDSTDRRTLGRKEHSDRSLSTAKDGKRALCSREQSDRSVATAKDDKRALYSREQYDRSVETSKNDKRALCSREESDRSVATTKDDKRASYSREQSVCSVGTSKRGKMRRRFKGASGSRSSISTTNRRRHGNSNTASCSSSSSEFPSVLHQLIIADMWLQDPNLIESRLKSFNDSLTDPSIPHPTKRVIDSIGVAAPVVGAMRKWAVYNGIQREACRLIHAVVTRECIALSFAECGAFKQIMSAMTFFALDETIQASGCAALLALTCKNNVSLSARLVKEDGLKVIATAMTNFSSSKRIQQRGALVFCCVDEYKELRPAVRAHRDTTTNKET